MDKIKCLYCQTEFEPKRETAKFCKDSCRVLWHRKNGGNRAVTKTQIQVLYNAVLEAVSKINYQPTTEASFDGKRVMPVNDEPLNFAALKSQITAPTNDFFKQMDKAQSLDELEAIGRKVKASGMTWKEQQKYHDYGKMIAKQKFIE